MVDATRQPDESHGMPLMAERLSPDGAIVCATDQYAISESAPAPPTVISAAAPTVTASTTN